MKTKILLLGLTSFLFVLAGCSQKTTSSSSLPNSSSSESDSSSSESDSSSLDSSQGYEEFYLTGNLNLNSDKVQLTREGDTYTYRDVTLRRGDSFLLYSASKRIGYDALTEKSGFAAGSNNYINVIGEGVYDLSLTAGETYALTLTKTGSSYKDVKLVFQSGKESQAFTMNDDFTYFLDDVDLRFNEKFYITLDDEIMTYDDVMYNETYVDGLRFDQTSINTIKKGVFNFRIDFNNTKPLNIYSEAMVNPNVAPTDAYTYENLVNELAGQFHAFGTKMTATEKTITGTTVTVDKSYLQTLNTNEQYYEETDNLTEVISMRANVYNETNYYEITDYKNAPASSTPSLRGKLIGTASEEDTQDPNSTIVKVEKEYISQETAQDNILKLTGYNHTAVGLLNNVLSMRHTQSVSDAENAAYRAAMLIEAKYDNAVGDQITINVKNTEIKDVAYGTDTYIENEVEFTLDERGYLVKGEVKLVDYSGNNVIDSDKKLVEGTPITKQSEYTFEFEYGEREMVEQFTLDLDSRVTTDIMCVDNLYLDCGATISATDIAPLGGVSFPMTAIDRNNFQIMEYDSFYITKGYSSYSAGSHAGQTQLVIGNVYSDVTYTINVTISFKNPTSITIYADGSHGNTYFDGNDYRFYTTVSSNGNPLVDITISETDSEYIQLLDVSDDASVLETNKTYFTIRTLKPSNNNVTITVKSRVSPTVTTTKTFTIAKQFTTETISGRYTYSSYSSESEAILNADGTGELKCSGTTHQFNYTIENGCNLALVSSETLTELKGEISYTDQQLGIFRIYGLTAKTEAGYVTGFSSTYSYFYQDVKMFENTYQAIDGDDVYTLTFNVTSNSSSGPKATFAIVKEGQDIPVVRTDGYAPHASSNSSKFDYFYFADYSNGSSSVSGGYYITLTYENYSLDGFTMRIESTSYSYKTVLTFNFTLVTD